MKLPRLASSWPWPSCKQQPRTHSLRFSGGDSMVTPPESPWFTTNSAASSNSASFSTVSEDYNTTGDHQVETVIRGLRSERLFYEPRESNSILKKGKNDGFLFKESVMVAMDSKDPYVDFRCSMEEMVEAYELNDWEGLVELLSWYLRVNGSKNYEYILGAFVDLLVGITSSSSAPSQGKIPCLEI